MTFDEAKEQLARKLDIDYADIANNDLFSAADLGAYIQLGLLEAWDYKPWPFTRKAKTFTTTSDMVSSGYLDHPVDIMLGSIYRVKVGGKRFSKLDFDDYENALEDDPTSTDRLWSDWETYIFINPSAYSVGATADLFGKAMAPALSGSSDLLPFSPQTDNAEHSGNHAIVKLAYAQILGGGKRRDRPQAAVERKEALAILDQVWQPFADTKANAQNTGRSMFNITDMFGSGGSSRNNIGNFN